METIPGQQLPKIAKCEPALVKLEKGKTYAWCTCGLSENQPFCDAGHKKIEGGELKSLKLTAEEDAEVWLCQCKQTGTPPYCDGSHNSLRANSTLSI